jgi:hypothetical protein
MKTFAILFTWAALLSGASLRSDERPAPAGQCCAGKLQVAELLAAWKSAVAEAGKLPDDEKAKIGERLSSLVKACPFGSRVGETLAIAHQTLAAAAAFDEAHAKSCPLSKAASETGAAEGANCRQGVELKTARSKLIRELNELSSQAVAVVAKLQCAEKPAGKLAAGEGGASGACCEALRARVLALKWSWDKAPADLAKLSDAQKAELKAQGETLAAAFKPAGLVAPTVLALAKGFEALDELNAQLCEWAKGQPDLLKGVPDEVQRAFAAQSAAIREVREVLGSARKALAEHCGQCRGEAGAAGVPAAKA